MSRVTGTHLPLRVRLPRDSRRAAPAVCPCSGAGWSRARRGLETLGQPRTRGRVLVLEVAVDVAAGVQRPLDPPGPHAQLGLAVGRAPQPQVPEWLPHQLVLAGGGVVCVRNTAGDLALGQN